MSAIALPTSSRPSQWIGLVAIGALIMLMGYRIPYPARMSMPHPGVSESAPPSELCEDIHNAASVSEADVETAIAASDAGDCVVVPAGSASWAGGVAFTGITLIGPGKNAGSPATVTAGVVTMTKHATEYTRLIGFRFTEDSATEHVSVEGSVTNKAFVIHNNYFFIGGGDNMRTETNGGLYSENDFVGPVCDGSPESNGIIFSLGGGAGGAAGTSWTNALERGDEDADGEGNTYIEDGLWENITVGAVDNDDGSRLVIRHNIIRDSRLSTHGGGSGNGGQDTSYHGGRWLEINDNTFDRSDDNCELNDWLWQRGSTGIFANNVLDDASSSNGNYPNKPELRFSVGCPGNPGYPMPFQFGQSTITPDATPDSPFLIFGNTGAGASSGNFIVISGESGEGITCSVPNDYIQSGRDYVLSNSYSWTAYEYPHPLHPSVDGSGDL